MLAAVNQAQRDRWVGRLRDAGDACISLLFVALRKEFRDVADEYEAGQWDHTIHADRLTHLLQLHYASTGTRFARLGREMLGEERAPAPPGAIGRALAALGAILETREDIYFGDRVADMIRSQAAERARQIADHSQGILTEVLAEAGRQGLGEAATARLLRKALVEEGLSISRARMIARTEIGAAQNAGMLAAADEIGATVLKTWVSIHDGRTRQTHVAVDGKTISQGQKFQVGDGQLEYPGDPSGPTEEIINCRCTMFLEQAPT